MDARQVSELFSLSMRSFSFSHLVSFHRLVVVCSQLPLFSSFSLVFALSFQLAVARCVLSGVCSVYELWQFVLCACTGHVLVFNFIYYIFLTTTWSTQFLTVFLFLISVFIYFNVWFTWRHVPSLSELFLQTTFSSTTLWPSRIWWFCVLLFQSNYLLTLFCCHRLLIKFSSHVFFLKTTSFIV